MLNVYRYSLSGVDADSGAIIHKYHSLSAQFHFSLNEHSRTAEIIEAAANHFQITRRQISALTWMLNVPLLTTRKGRRGREENREGQSR